jgi:hypothetical protein
MRQKEEERKKKMPPPKDTAASLKMHLPQAEEEDIEVIEVDEGEIGEVLEGEPLLARLIFKTQSFFEEVKIKLFETHAQELPPKLPPQFFKPPAGKKAPSQLVPTGVQSASAAVAAIEPAPGSTGAAKAKARIIPEAQAPRRVRVIRRVRKPVRVSFIDENGVSARIDIAHRRFTLILMAVLFLALAGGAFGMLRWQGERAQQNLQEAKMRLAAEQQTAQTKLQNWENYRDLEPRLKALSVLLDRHMSPSRLFESLEANTVPEVFYSSFTLSPDGRLILGTTASSFETAARQLVAFETSGLTNNVQAMGYQAMYGADGKISGVSFQIGLTLKPDVLRTAAPQPMATR